MLELALVFVIMEHLFQEKLGVDASRVKMWPFMPALIARPGGMLKLCHLRPDPATEGEMCILGRDYRFEVKPESDLLKPYCKIDGEFVPGAFVPNQQKSDAFFIPDLLPGETQPTRIDFVERSFYAGPEVATLEDMFFTSEEYTQDPAAICLEIFSVLGAEMDEAVDTGKMTPEEYLNRFQEKTGIFYNSRIKSILLQRGMALRRWALCYEHEIRRPIFATRDRFNQFEEAALREAENVHHRTNNAFKGVDFKKLSFEDALERAKAYLFGVLGFSRSRIRDVIAEVVTEIVRNARRGPTERAKRLSFLISPSFKAAAIDLKHLFGERINLRTINLEHEALTQEIPSAKDGYPVNPLRQIRTALLTQAPSLASVNLMLARELVFQLVRKMHHKFDLQTSLGQIEVDYHAMKFVNGLDFEQCVLEYDRLREES